MCKSEAALTGSLFSRRGNLELIFYQHNCLSLQQGALPTQAMAEPLQAVLVLLHTHFLHLSAQDRFSSQLVVRGRQRPAYEAFAPRFLPD